jgi:DNA-binding transcriptional MerR regulator
MDKKEIDLNLKDIKEMLQKPDQKLECEIKIKDSALYACDKTGSERHQWWAVGPGFDLVMNILSEYDTETVNPKLTKEDREEILIKLMSKGLREQD